MQVDFIEHQAVGAGIGERHVLEADALLQSLGHGQRRRPRTSDAA